MHLVSGVHDVMEHCVLLTFYPLLCFFEEKDWHCLHSRCGEHPYTSYTIVFFDHTSEARKLPVRVVETNGVFRQCNAHRKGVKRRVSKTLQFPFVFPAEQPGTLPGQLYCGGKNVFRFDVFLWWSRFHTKWQRRKKRGREFLM